MQKLKELETIARKLEPGQDQRNAISKKIENYIGNFIEGLPDAPGYVEGRCKKLRELEIGEEGKSIDQLLDILGDEVDKIGINSASGAHLGYIPGGGLWTSAIGDMLAAATNRYAGIAYSSPGAVAIENQMIRWLCSVVGYPDKAHGNLSSGGSIANLIAIKAAREYHNIDSTNVKKSVIYLTAHTHHCVKKALNITGLHETVVRPISMDYRYRMDVDALQEQMAADRKKGLTPFLVVATAGTTDTGAIDPLDSIADLCSEYDVWFHVDAAYGGFFMLVDAMKDKFKGIERSDSVVMDPHKTLFLPYGSGVVLVKNRDVLLNSNSEKAAYMNDAYGHEQISPADTGPELSKHFRGLRMWLPLHLHGVEPFRANLEEKIHLCQFFHEKIAEMGFQTGPEPDLSITRFRYPGDENNDLTRALIDRLHNDGSFFFSSTTINGELWIRCAVVSFRTHLNDIQQALQMIRESMQRELAI